MKSLLSVKNIKGGEICPYAKFRFNFIIVARNITDKHFSSGQKNKTTTTKTRPDPGLKYLELKNPRFKFSLNQKRRSLN